MSLHHNQFAPSTTNPLPQEQQLSCGSASSGSFLTDSGETGDGSDRDEEQGSVSELTRQMASYNLQDDDKHSDGELKMWGFSGSTLLPPFGSREPSPPVTEEYGWDATKLHHEQPRHMPSVPARDTNQALTDYQIQAIQFYKLKQEQAARKQSKQLESQKLQHLQNKEKPKTRSSPNPWSGPGPAQQHYPKSSQLQPSGSGMRAVFLGGSGSRSRSCGTGVFLPRGDRSNPSESRKKPGCSTVLIPARVAQALKLHFEQVGVVSRANTNNIVGNASDSRSQHDVGKDQDHKWHFQSVPASKNHQYDMGLPQEWTY